MWLEKPNFPDYKRKKLPRRILPAIHRQAFLYWTGGRVVEGTALEKRQGFTPFVGSNPTLSASLSFKQNGSSF